MYKRQVCLLLSGSNNDGTKGLQKVKEKGGRVIIQNPATANIPFMPGHAVNNVEANAVLNAEEMADFINHLNNKP